MEIGQVRVSKFQTEIFETSILAHHLQVLRALHLEMIDLQEEEMEAVEELFLLPVSRQKCLKPAKDLGL